MAEAITRKLTIERGVSDLEAMSAGTAANDGSPASDGALLVGMERHLDLGQHRSQTLTRGLVESADLVLAMGNHHLQQIDALGGSGKSYLLADYASRGASVRAISDPMGAELSVYRDTADELEEEIGRLLDRITADRSADSGGS
jgi:protein-tyrosine-phosphatase